MINPRITTVDIRPTWRGLMPFLIACVQGGVNAEARTIATEELYRLAEFADEVNAAKKEEGR